MIRRGDIVEFKAKGPTAFLLGGIVKLLEPSWDKYGWHLGMVYRYDATTSQVWVVESRAGGVRVNRYSWEELQTRVRTYHWLGFVDKTTFERIAKRYIGVPYDVTAYFGVVFWYFIKKLTGKSFRVHDRELMCWEHVSLMCRDLGKPLQEIWDYPLISDIIRTLQVAQARRQSG